MSRFFSDEAYESQIDPFNADEPVMPWSGEPVMPWDDPEALHDDSCNLPVDDSYVAKEKPNDNYQAPERPTPRHAKRPAKPVTWTRQAANQKQSAAAHGKPGRTHSIQKALAVIAVIMTLFSAFSSCASHTINSLLDGLDDSHDEGALYNPGADYSQEETNADEQAIANMISARMDNLADNPEIVNLARQGLDENLQTHVGYTAEELGIDADAYATWFFSKLSYQIEYAYSYDDGTGSVALEITSPVTHRIASDLYDKASDFIRENELYGSYDGTEADPLTPEQQSQMRKLFDDVLTAAELRTDGYLNAAVSKNAEGTWQIDENDFQQGIDYLLGVS